MRYQNARRAAPAVLLSLIAGVACRDDARDATATDALQRDLALAQSSAVTLAPSTRDLPATRFVSALEGGERALAGAGRAAHPIRHSATKAQAMRADHAAPAVASVVAQAPAAAATESAPAPAPESVAIGQSSGRASGESASELPNDGEVTVARPSDGDGTVPTPERRRGRGLGGIFGGIGGAVIRGGSVGDDDHCERDHPRGLGGMLGMPGRFPGSGGTFGVPPTGIGRGPGIRY